MLSPWGTGRGLVILGVVGATAGCAGRVDDHGFARSLGLDWSALERTASGLYVQEIRAGQGPAAAVGTRITVHYTGWLQDGTMFQTSRTGDPPTFTLGEVIEGWNEGVAGMRVGGRRKLVIPPDLGYGDQGSPPDIPPGATLVFDIELLAVAS